MNIARSKAIWLPSPNSFIACPLIASIDGIMPWRLKASVKISPKYNRVSYNYADSAELEI